MRQFMMGFYILIFFAYLLEPLVMMGATAFSDNTYPQVAPWNDFTLKWFEELVTDSFMVEGFISSYTMLIFLARLQRFDNTLEEAALDLGACHVQVFWQVLVPFLKPALISAAMLAFLTSFENYNTTVFTIQAESTLTTVLASKVRLGITPAVSALAVLIIGLPLVGAVVHEVLRRRERTEVKAE